MPERYLAVPGFESGGPGVHDGSGRTADAREEYSFVEETMMSIIGKKSRLTAALLFAGAATAALATNAEAVTGYHLLRNAAYVQCVNAPDGTLNVRLQLAGCLSGSGTQLWAMVPTGAANTYYIVNRASGYCMEVNNGTSTPGETVDEFTCNGSTAEQWVLEGLTLRHAGTNQCLDTVSGRNSQLMQYTCGQASPAGAQSWVVV